MGSRANTMISTGCTLAFVIEILSDMNIPVINTYDAIRASTRVHMKKRETRDAKYIKNIVDDIGSVDFLCFTDEDVSKLSVRAITERASFDVFGNVVNGGLYDISMGPIDKKTPCEICSLDSNSCPGHFGRIEFPLPIYNPLLFDPLFRLLRVLCLRCCRFRIDAGEIYVIAAKLRLIRGGFFIPALLLDEHIIIEAGKKLHENDLMQEETNVAFQEQDEAENLEIGEDSEEGEEDEEYDSEFATDDETSSVGEHEEIPVENLGSISKKKRVDKSELDVSISEALQDKKSGPKAKSKTTSMRKLGKAKFSFEELKKVVDRFVEDSESRPIENGEQPNSIIKELRRSIIGELLSIKSGRVVCAHCRAEVPSLQSVQKRIIFRKPLSGRRIESMIRKKLGKDVEEFRKRKLLTVVDVERIIQKAWVNERNLLEEIYPRGSITHNSFCLRMILVPPNRFRPVRWKDGRAFDFEMNSLYKIVISDKKKLEASIMATEEDSVELYNQWSMLQGAVNELFDSSDGAGATGLTQVLEKKEGLFRRHMMGKRVDFAARSVISPDPYLETDEIGLPEVFAKTLTYPEGVNRHNVELLQELVANGLEEYPGASSIEVLQTGRVIKLKGMNKGDREKVSISLPKYIGIAVVRRNLRDGDYVLVNRQPTLHKSSIMCLRAKVLYGEKTIRMHYSNCKSLNADFDGDEVNVHFPQNELARAEAALIAHADFQYIVPTNGAPIRGLIQDHIVSGVLLTKKDTFISKSDYMFLANIACSALEGYKSKYRMKLLKPCIQKPIELWSGKQLISTILINLAEIVRGGQAKYITLRGKSSVNTGMWGGAVARNGQKVTRKSFMSDVNDENEVYFLDGEMMHGILDKKQFGSSSYGLVHTVNEIYGEHASGKLLTGLGRMFTAFLQIHGFSCCIDDILLDEAAEGRRKESLARIGQDVDIPVQRDIVDVLGAEKEVSKNSSSDGHSTPDVSTAEEDSEKLVHSLKENREETIKLMDSMMKTALSRQTSDVIGKCIPSGLLKDFPRNNFAVMTFAGSKGSLVNFAQVSCLLGQQELEGKRVPMMPTLRTLPSFRRMDFRSRAGGYIVDRFLYGIRPQEFFYHCMAGREGLIDTAVKTSNSGYLQRSLIKHMEDLHVHYDNTVRSSDGSVIQFIYGDDGLDVTKAAYLCQFDTFSDNLSSFTGKDTTTVRVNKDLTPKAYRKSVRKYRKEKGLKNHNLDRVMRQRFAGSLVEPGEAVGLLAAQSIGEPSTQMTLNTFHLAGHGAINITLGIPRLKEILMTGSSSTPTMTMKLKNASSKEAASRVVSRFNRTTLGDVIHAITVRESYNLISDQHTYLLSLGLDVEKLDGTGIQNAEEKTKRFIKGAFLQQLKKKLKNEMRRQKSQELYMSELRTEHYAFEKSSTLAGSEQGEVEDNESVEKTRISDDILEDEENDEFVRRKKEHTSYEDPDSDDERLVGENSSKGNSYTNKLENEDYEPLERRERKSTHGKIGIGECKFDGHNVIVEITVPMKMNVLIAEIAEDLAKTLNLASVPGITKCVTTREVTGEYVVQTDGINLTAAVLVDDDIFVEQIRTSMISAFAETFGIEGARALIIEEINSVFEVYGIEVDIRHLNLVADYMTYSGKYVSMNRYGMRDNVSPFKKMSFETTASFLRDATINGDNDLFETPSSSISIGQLVKSGTGTFDLLHDVKER